MKKLLMALFVCLPLTVWAWTPQKPVTIVVGFPAGGNVDNVARIIERGMERQGIKSVVENRAGAGGVIAANHVLKSGPDGHTIMLTPTSFVFSKLLKRAGTEYDVIDDWSHVAFIGTVENHIYGNSKVEGDMGQVIVDTKSGKRRYRWGVTNPGAEFSAHLIAHTINTNIDIVTYNGSPQAIADLLGGHIDLVIDSGTSTLRQHTQEGRVRLLATLNNKRDDRTALDNHLPGVITFSFFGLSLRKDIPLAARDYYQSVLTRVLADVETQRELKHLGVKANQSVSLRDVVKSQMSLYAPIANKITSH